MTAALDIDGPAAPPRRNGELVFAEPWESRAFGLAVALDAAGAISWEDFRRQLIATIAEWEEEHVAEEAWSYYRCWLSALEQMVVSEGLVGADDIGQRCAELAARAPTHDHRPDGAGDGPDDGAGDGPDHRHHRHDV